MPPGDEPELRDTSTPEAILEDAADALRCTCGASPAFLMGGWVTPELLIEVVKEGGWDEAIDGPFETADANHRHDVMMDVGRILAAADKALGRRPA